MATAEDVLKAFRKYLGVSGRPNPASQWYSKLKGVNFLTAAWCDMQVSKAGTDAKASDIVGVFAYCPYHVRWFKGRGQWGIKPRKGAIVFFDWDRDGVADHVGIVEAVNKDGSITTIEGNTGNACKRKVRSGPSIMGYGYPAYAGTTAPKPSVPDGASRDRSVPYPGTLIRSGSRGPTVKQVQQQLISKGYKLPKFGADGDFGSETLAAVKAFQKKSKLSVDGIVGPQTWGALFA